MASPFVTPQAQRNHEGQPRRVGVEVEFSGLTLKEAGSVVARAAQGELELTSDYEGVIHSEHLGDIKIELDYAYLKRVGRRESIPTGLLGELEKLSEDIVGAVAKRVVPLEIVSPPLTFSQLPALQSLMDALRDAGAVGTRHSALFAFGVHFNPELPALDAPTIDAYLKAFVCLYPWLIHADNVDLSRRATPFIQPFSRAYERTVLTRTSGTVADIIDDYLLHNPTRNRPNDFLPLFSHVDAARVQAAVDDDRVNARPTLHYRLPNCEVDDPEWSLAHPWNQFVQLDDLANDRDRLDTISAAYLAYLDRDWVTACEQFITGGAS